MSCPHQDDAARWLLGELEGDEVALHIAGCPACAALADAYVAVLSVAAPACADEAATLAWLYGEEDDAAGVHAATCPACARLVRAHSDALTAVAPVVPALRAPVKRSGSALPAPGGALEAASATAGSGRRWQGWIALAAAAALMLALAQTSVVPSPDLSGAPDLSPTRGALASSAPVPSPVAAPAASPAARPALASASGSSAATASPAPPAGSRLARAAPSTPRPQPARRGPRLASSPAAHPAGPLPVAVLADDVDLDRRLDALSAELAAFASDPSLL